MLIQAHINFTSIRCVFHALRIARPGLGVNKKVKQKDFSLTISLRPLESTNAILTQQVLNMSQTGPGYVLDTARTGQF